MTTCNNVGTRLNYTDWIERQSTGFKPFTILADGTSAAEMMDRWSNVCLNADDITVDSDGSIDFMPTVKVPPCFGDIITYYKGVALPKKANGWAIYSKCTKCKAEAACSEVFVTRVASDDDMTESFNSCMKSDGFRLNTGSAYDRFVAAIIKRGPFKSITDDFDAARWRSSADGQLRKAEMKRIWDREYARARRNERVSSGIIDPETLEMLLDEHQARCRILHAKTGAGIGAPPTFRHLRLAQCEMIADVWLGAVVTTIESKGRSNPHRIAAWLAKHRSAKFPTVHAADARVRKDLARIRLLNSSDPTHGLWRNRAILLALDGAEAFREALFNLIGQE